MRCEFVGPAVVAAPSTRALFTSADAFDAVSSVKLSDDALVCTFEDAGVSDGCACSMDETGCGATLLSPIGCGERCGGCSVVRAEGRDAAVSVEAPLPKDALDIEVGACW